MDRNSLILYGRDACCLCDRLGEMLDRELQRIPGGSAVSISKRSIDENPSWRDCYGHRIPVVTCGGQVVLEGRPEPEEVRAALERLLGPGC